MTGSSEISEGGCTEITADAAREIAERHIRTLGDDLTLLEEPVTSGDYGWVFSYQSIAFIETNDLRDALAGNAPILVDSNRGRVFTLGTVHEVYRYVHMYQRFGDPHAEPGPTLELRDWRTGAEEVVATREIRAYTQLGLKEAKRAVDACLDGKKPLLQCADPETAEVLARKLIAAGFQVRQLALWLRAQSEPQTHF